MRKKAGYILLLISIIVMVYMIGFVPKRVSYEDLITTSDVYNELKNTREQTDSLQLQLCFDEQELTSEKGKNTFYYSLVEGSSTAENPLVEWKSDVDDLHIAFCDGAMTDDAISNNQKIAFIAYTDTAYQEYFLSLTTLPIMNISCESEIADDKVEMTISLFDNQKGCSNRVINSEGTIKIRGASTRRYPKKSYKITLMQESTGGNQRTNNVSLLGMRQDDDWILYAGYNDQEKIRNVFSQKMWKISCATDNQYAVDAGMEYKYLEVFINGEYYGLYALGYPIDEKQLELSGNTSEDVLYQKISWAEESLLDVNEKDSNGYRIKKSGSLSEDDSAWDLLYTYYENLSENRENPDELKKWIDMDNAIDIYLFFNLIQGKDNVNSKYVKNFYLSLTTRDGQISSLYVPWDLDISWGNSWVSDPEVNMTLSYNTAEDVNCVMENGYLNQILMYDDTVWDSVIRKYWSLRKGAWSQESLMSILDDYEDDIYNSGAYYREMERWPDGSYQDPEDKLSVFKNYVSDRLNAMDSYIESVENSPKSFFIIRSLQYTYFLQSDFVVEINNKELLENDRYTDFLEYLGIDVSKITEDIHFVVGNCEKGYEYYSSLGTVGDSVSTILGTIESLRDEIKEYNTEDGYSVYLNSKLLYNTESGDTPDIRFIYQYNGSAHTFDFTEDFVMSE